MRLRQIIERCSALAFELVVREVTNLRLDGDLPRDAGDPDVNESQDAVAVTLVLSSPQTRNILLDELVVHRNFLHDELHALVVPQTLLMKHEFKDVAKNVETVSETILESEESLRIRTLNSSIP